MKRIAFLVAAAAAFGLWPFAGRLGPVTGSFALLALAVLLALAASGSFSPLAAAGGALGAFAGAVLATASPAASGAALLGLAYAERASRVRGASARLAHAGGAVLAGALAGSLGAAYASSSLTVRGVAVVLAAVLAALPLLVAADDPIAHALDLAAGAVAEPARSSLRSGADLCRTAEPELLDRGAARDVRRTWRRLLELAEARVKIEARGGASAARATPVSEHAAAIREMVDRRIADHVAVLARTYAAAGTAEAAKTGLAVSLDDAALKKVETVGESLNAVSDAVAKAVAEA